MRSLIVVCMVIVAASAQECPKTDLSPDFYKDKKPYDPNNYDGDRRAEDELARAIGEQSVENLKKSAECAAPVFIDTVLRPQTVCEPCPHREYNLLSFYGGRCTVIYPQYQRVRYVRCTYRSCTQFCPCHHAYCRTASWHMSWFFAYCSESVGNWHTGLNYNYLWLPQDCKCQAYSWIKEEKSDKS